MPRYFFNLHNHVQTVDPEGQELADVAAASVMAARIAKERAAASIREHGSLNLTHSIEVKDGGDRTVLTVTFGQAVRVSGAGS